MPVEWNAGRSLVLRHLGPAEAPTSRAAGPNRRGSSWASPDAFIHKEFTTAGEV